VGTATVVNEFAGYSEETLSSEDDDGTMVANVAALRQEVVGHKIASAELVKGTFVIELDDGRRVSLRNTDDCCAHTELESFLLNPELVDHIITGVGTTDGYTTWHVFADMGDVLKLSVGWSCGNPFYYGYGFDIIVASEVDPA
jgi:hypothetical protein